MRLSSTRMLSKVAKTPVRVFAKSAKADKEDAA